MNKTFILFLLLIAQIKGGVFYTPFITNFYSISEIDQIAVEKLDCSLGLLQISQSIKIWQEIIENEEELNKDIYSLQSIQIQVKEFRYFPDHRQIFTQIKTSFFRNIMQVGVLDQSLYQQWRKEGIEGLQRQLNLLDQARSIDESQACCDRIEKLIEKMLSEREEIKTESQKPQITINIINSKADQVQKKQEQCEAYGIKLDSLKEKDKTKNRKIPEKSESLNVFEQDEEVNTDARKKISQVNKEEPVQVRADDKDNTKNKEIPEESEYVSVSKKKQQFKAADKKPPPTANFALLESESPQQAPLMDKQINVQQHLQEYGYGFWLRFLTIYPVRLPNGKNLALYFVSGLTTKEPYENIKMGDRTLAIWQGQGNYIFVSCKTVNVDPNVVGSINYPVDIEGVWNYSYSVEHQKAIGFIKFADSDFQTVVQPVTHPIANQLRFILAGNDEKIYPKFNGLFTRVIFNNQLGAYIAQLQILQQLVASQGPTPSVIVQDLISQDLVDGVAERYPTDDIKVIQVTDARLSHEYAISGWFKFVQPTNQADWHSAFRVQVTTPGKDWTLGDRVLMYELGKSGEIWTSTYTYTNMNGAGSANIPTYIPHQNRPYQWHFVYQGYSKLQSLAYFIAKFTNSQESFLWTNTKHYYPGQFHILLGSTHYLQGWNGQHAFVSFHTGKGAFKVGSDYGDPQDRFKQIAAANTILNPGYQKPPPTTYPALLESKQSQEEPLMDKQINVQQNFQEYGYGFWLRFLTIYPERLPSGKSLTLSLFVSRLTTNQEYGNRNMGDRILAIWQGQLSYLFNTCNTVNGSPAVESVINFPADIEGVWTYIYYSYSVVHKKTVGFIKFADSDFQTFVQSVTHPNTNYLRFILGGNDVRRYLGFNGLFTRVIFNDQLGAYISQVQDLQQLVASQGPAPSVIVQDLISHDLVDGVVEGYPTDEIKVIQVTDVRLPQEYAISGWFKFVQPSIQADYHSAYRVQVTTPGKDGTLGDRVFLYSIGKENNGIIFISTYKYQNMNGAGDPDIKLKLPHQQRPYQWHFVYQGYSKPLSLAYFIAKFTNSQESFQWTDTQHYYPGQFHILLGTTHFRPGWNGQYAFVSFHTGKGAFKVGSDYGDPQDRFKQIAAANSIVMQSLSTIQKQKKCQSTLIVNCSQQ